MDVILFSDDINLVDYWKKVLDFQCHICYDEKDLLEIEGAIIIMNYTACPSLCSSFISQLVEQNNRILILHRTPTLEVAKRLLGLGVMGYGNALMRDHFILSAVAALKDDMIWLYPTFTAELIAQMNPQNSEPNKELLEVLSQREKEVAHLLKDGLTYKEIAQKLDITPRTVKAHASKIYEKLNVKDKLSLSLLLN